MKRQRSRGNKNSRALLVWCCMILLACVSVAYHMSKP
jgi:hypothetical protein